MNDKYIQSNKDKRRGSNELYESKVSDCCHPKVNDTEMIKTNIVKVYMQNCVMGN